MPYDDEDDDPILDRRRHARRTQTALLVGGLAAGAALTALAGLVAAVLLLRPHAPVPVASPAPQPVVTPPPVAVTPAPQPVPPRPTPPAVTPAPFDPKPGDPLAPRGKAFQSPPAPAPAPAAVPTEPVAAPGPESPRSAERPAKESPPGYYTRAVEGFTVIVSKLAYDESDAADRRPLGYLEAEFARLKAVLPPETLAALARVPVWVEWDHAAPENPARNYAIYYGGTGEGLAARGVDPRKAGCVCLLSLKAAHRLHAAGKLRSAVVLHELAHAVHDRVLGAANPVVLNAFDQARSRRLYERVRHADGRVGPGYAGTNASEYFAELTCCYLDRLDYAPLDRAALKGHDSVGFELMARVWGAPEAIEARLKAAREAAEKPKVKVLR